MNAKRYVETFLDEDLAIQLANIRHALEWLALCDGATEEVTSMLHKIAGLIGALEVRALAVHKASAMGGDMAGVPCERSAIESTIKSMSRVEQDR